MAAHWIWWVLGAVLIGAELMTGTFYLLAVGIAFALGGLAAWLGASTPIQLTVGGVMSVLGTIIAHQWRRRMGVPPPQPPLDVGASVHVRTWNPDGTARVDYRGSQWNAELAAADAPRAETMYIVATRGSTLVLSAQRP